MSNEMHKARAAFGLGAEAWRPFTAATPEQRARAEAWLLAWHALSAEQKTRWRSMTPAEMQASKQLTPAELTDSMAPANSPEVAAIAADLIAVMAENDRLAAA
jgi:hypothetical protein